MADRADVAAAVDINRDALAVYRLNFPHRTCSLTIESIPAANYRHWNADLWWLSPPCQPYMHRSRRRDLDDPRAESFRAVLARLQDIRPRYVALENVVGFLNSRAHHLLREVLDRGGYRAAERVLCPTELGIPNRRPRFYLVASQDDLQSWPALRRQPRSVRDFLDPDPQEAVFVPHALVEQYWNGIDVVHTNELGAVTCCFTSGYGRSVVRCGSYLFDGSKTRRFTPREVLRFLGFREKYVLPPNLPLRRGWSLAGNSLSVDAVPWVLATIPELAIAAKPLQPAASELVE